MPRARDGTLTLELGEVTFTVDPERGARIVRFAMAGENVLAGPEVDPENFGATFWPSPQSAWGWPPAPELDREPYEVAEDAQGLVMSSRPGSAPEVRVTKRFAVEPARRAVRVDYALENTGHRAARWAPWEITRVAPGGLTFFPAGLRVTRDELGVETLAGITWYRSEPSRIASPSGQKLVADGAGGWLAHVAGDLLLLKVFDDTRPDAQAPGEGEIELYASGPGARRGAYVELELQGAYASLEVAERLAWTVRWLLRELPPAVPRAVGSAGLVRFAASLAEVARGGRPAERRDT